jgi:hypothetical protein
MTIIQQLLDAGIPVIPAESDETSGSYSFQSLTPEQEAIAKDIIHPPTPAILRKRNAKSQAALATALKSVTPQQAADYISQQITGGTSEATALAAFDSATTFAAAKPILRNMLVGMYRTVDILKLIARILVALRDENWPDLPDL